MIRMRQMHQGHWILISAMTPGGSGKEDGENSYMEKLISCVFDISSGNLNYGCLIFNYDRNYMRYVLG